MRLTGTAFYSVFELNGERFASRERDPKSPTRLPLRRRVVDATFRGGAPAQSDINIVLDLFN
jgi:hypothetical protein